MSNEAIGRWVRIPKGEASTVLYSSVDIEPPGLRGYYTLTPEMLHRLLTEAGYERVDGDS